MQQSVCRLQSHLVAVLLEQFFGGFGRREGGLVRKRELQEEKTQTGDGCTAFHPHIHTQETSEQSGAAKEANTLICFR